MNIKLITLMCAAVLSFATPLGAQQVVDAVTAKDALRHYRAGQDALQREQFDQALSSFSEAVRLDPMLALAHYGRGQAHMALKDFPAAVQDFTTCRQTYERMAGLAMSRGAEMTQRIDDEIRELKNTLRRMQQEQGVGGDPPLKALNVETRIRELERMRNTGAEAIHAPAEVSLALGSAYFRQDRFEDAEREYRAALALNPKFGEAHNNLAVVLFSTGRLDEARREADAARKAGYRVNPSFLHDLDAAR
jgi:tetratricopeptide (TPR) repeat protein